jgi:transcription antitermination factor NusG
MRPTHPVVHIDFITALGNSALVSELLWYVAHTKPRREKKLAEFCEREGFSFALPCYDSARKYRGKSVVFHKPLFPGYVFLQLLSHNASTLRQNDLVANLLEVFDQATLARQLREILTALESGLVLRAAPEIGEGARVRIKSGPLQGVEGWVEKRHGANVVLLRLDFINQAASVKVEAELLEPI